MKKFIALAIILTCGLSFAQVNVATVNQSAAPGHEATITQTGSPNEAHISQSLSIDGGLATITQIGTLNYGLTSQTGNQFQGVSYGEIYQEGTENRGVQNQVVYGGGGYIRVVDIYQKGNLNQATQTQSHSGGGGSVEMYSDQFGDDNEVIQWQAGSTGGKYSEVKQGTSLVNGSFNEAKIYQDGIGGSYHAVVTQDGSANIVFIDQDGAAGLVNSAVIYQEMNSNTAKLDQDGGTASVDQTVGDLNVVNLKQNGNAQADIDQNGDHNVVMGLDVNPLGTSLNGSTLDVDQVGSSNILHLQQTNGAGTIVSQDGLTNTVEVIQN